jgi:hypothetical protein
MTRRRRTPEHRRLDRLGPEGRRAEIARLAESLDVADPRPASPEPAPSVEQVVARELARVRQVERQMVEQAELDRRRCPVGRGCWRCGVLYSDTDDPQPWDVTAEGAACVWCHNDGVLLDRYGDTDDDRRVRTIARLLGETGLPMRAVSDPHAFAGIGLWFSEHPDAAPSVGEEQRWSHLDRAELRAQWNAIASGDGVGLPEVPEIEEGRTACKECGCREWFPAQESTTRFEDGHAEYRIMAPARCVDCSVLWIAHVTGRVPEWWVERRGKRTPDWAKQLMEVSA